MTAENPKKQVRLIVVGDLHYTVKTGGWVGELLTTIMRERPDALLLAGDLTDWGLPEEAQALTRELSAVPVPRVAVLGNHDYESGRHEEVMHIFREGGVTVLDGDATEVHGIGIAGIKGFIGGFDQRVLAPWGEQSIKKLVHEALDEALKLESALAKLRTPQRIALLHYAPIRATVEGEPLEIFPFLGCSRMEDPLDRFAVTAVFHGHAHNGACRGQTRGGIPVYNVSLPLMRRACADKPFVILDVPTN